MLGGKKGLVIKEDSGHSCSFVVHSQSYLISPLPLLLPYYYRPRSKHEIHRSNLCHSLELGNCRVGKTNPTRFNPTLYSSLNSSHHSHLIYMCLTCLKSTLTCRAAMRSESIPRRCLRQPWRSGRRSAVLSGKFTTQIVDCLPLPSYVTNTIVSSRPNVRQTITLANHSDRARQSAPKKEEDEAGRRNGRRNERERRKKGTRQFTSRQHGAPFQTNLNCPLYLRYSHLLNL